MKSSGSVRWMVVLLVVIGVVPSANAQDEDWQRVLAAAKKEGSVVSVSGILTGKAAVVGMKASKDSYGISLDFFPGRTSSAMEKIAMEQKSKSYVTDTLDAHGVTIIQLKKDGFLQSVADSLPALKENNKFKRAMIDDPEAQLITTVGISNYVCMNTNLVKAGEAPKSWQDLLDPKWKGKIMLTNPLYTSSLDQIILAFARTKAGLDENYFIKLYRNALVGGPGGADEAMDKVIRGEGTIGGFFSGNSALRPIREGAPIKPLDLKEGCVFKTLRIGALKNMPHPNATRVYINWLLSKEGQTLIAREADLEPMRNDVAQSLPFTLTGHQVPLTYEDVILAEERASKNYLANLLGLKK